MNKGELSESDIKAKFITPAILKAGWDELTQLGREIYFTDGRIYVKGKLTARGKRKLLLQVWTGTLAISYRLLKMLVFKLSQV